MKEVAEDARGKEDLYKQLVSVVFSWLRNERSGKRFSHTRLRVWVQMRGGLRSHGLACFQCFR